MAQEPPVPTPDEPPNFLPSSVTYMTIALIAVGVIAWKYKAFIEFLAVVCSTIGGFIVGAIATPPYANIGLGMMVSTAALLLSIAVVAIIRLKQRAKLHLYIDDKDKRKPSD
jgi:hypothetical protein